MAPAAAAHGLGGAKDAPHAACFGIDTESIANLSRAVKRELESYT